MRGRERSERRSEPSKSPHDLRLRALVQVRPDRTGAARAGIAGARTAGAALGARTAAARTRPAVGHDADDLLGHLAWIRLQLLVELDVAVERDLARDLVVGALAHRNRL